MTTLDNMAAKWEAERRARLDAEIPDVTRVPLGTFGPWTIKRKKVGEPSQLDRLRAAIHGSGRIVPAGTYTGLFHAERGIVMSDTPDEKRDHLQFVRAATGSVLIAGLGIGMVLQAVLAKPDVTDVTVIELDQSIIDWVGPVYADPRLTIICADILQWKLPPDKRWSACWFDIWDAMSEDNLPEMAKLSRRFTRRTDWYGHWGREVIVADRRRYG